MLRQSQSRWQLPDRQRSSCRGKASNGAQRSELSTSQRFCRFVHRGAFACKGGLFRAKCRSLKMRASAGTRSPPFKMMMSPGTRPQHRYSALLHRGALGRWQAPGDEAHPAPGRPATLSQIPRARSGREQSGWQLLRPRHPSSRRLRLQLRAGRRSGWRTDPAGYARPGVGECSAKCSGRRSLRRSSTWLELNPNAGLTFNA